MGIQVSVDDVNNAFDSIIGSIGSLTNDGVVAQSLNLKTLGEIRDSLLAGQSLTANQVNVWEGIGKTLFESGSNKGFDTFIKISIDYRDLVRPQARPSNHPYFPSMPHTENLTIDAYDLTGKPVGTQNRKVLFSDVEVNFDYSDKKLTITKNDKPFLSFTRDGRLWTVLRPDATNLASIHGEGILDSLLLPVIFLGDLGYFPDMQMLTYYNKIKLTNADLLSNGTLQGFSIALSDEDGWVPLVDATGLQDSTTLDLNLAITKENAGAVVANLVALAETLKHAGIILMDKESLYGIEVDPKSGKLRLPKDVRPMIRNASMFSRTFEEQAHGKMMDVAKDAVYTPDFRALGNRSISRFMRQQDLILLGLIDMISIKSEQQKKSSSYFIAWDALVDLYHYYLAANEDPEDERSDILFTINQRRDTLLQMFRYYHEQLDPDTLSVFARRLELKREKIQDFLASPEEWFEYARGVIDKAKTSATRSLEEHWKRSLDTLFNDPTDDRGRVLSFKSKKGNKGTPQSAPPVGGAMPGSPAASGGPPVGSASGHGTAHKSDPHKNFMLAIPVDAGDSTLQSGINVYGPPAFPVQTPVTIIK